MLNYAELQVIHCIANPT